MNSKSAYMSAIVFGLVAMSTVGAVHAAEVSASAKMQAEIDASAKKYVEEKAAAQKAAAEAKAAETLAKKHETNASSATNVLDTLSEDASALKEKAKAGIKSTVSDYHEEKSMDHLDDLKAALDAKAKAEAKVK